MALSKKLKLKNGLEASYHRIREVHINYIEDSVILILDSYINEISRKKQIEREKMVDDLNNLHGMIHEAEHSGNHELAEALNIKYTEIAEVLNLIAQIKYEAEISNYTISPIPDLIDIKTMYEIIMKDNITYKDSKEI